MAPAEQNGRGVSLPARAKRAAPTHYGSALCGISRVAVRRRGCSSDLPALSSIAQIFLSERTSFTSQQPRSLSIALTSTKLTSTFPGAERAGLSARLALAFGCHGDLDASLLGLRSAEIGVAGEGLPVAASLLAVAGGLAGAGQTTVGPYLFVLVTVLDRQGQLEFPRSPST